MKRLAVLLCLAGLLAACGSGKDSGPVSLPPVTATAVPSSPAPAVAAVPKPVDADAFSPAGAEAFVRYYIDVINVAIRTNSTATLASLSASECEGCQKYLQSIAETVAEGGQVDVGGISVLDVAAPPLQDGETTVVLEFSGSEYVSHRRDGSELHRVPATGPLTAELRCVRRNNSWLVMGFRLHASRTSIS